LCLADVGFVEGFDVARNRKALSDQELAAPVAHGVQNIE